MKFYGIEMKGYFKPEILASLPDFSIADQGRLIYLSSEKTLYLNDGTEYTIASGSAKTVATLPTFSASDEGQLYYDESTNKLNYNNGSEYVILGSLAVASLPVFSATNEGEVYYDETTKKLYYNNGTAHIPLDNLNVDNLVLDTNHVFADVTARNSYFVSNPSELVNNVLVLTGNTFQAYILGTTTWVDRVIAIRSGVSGALAEFKGRWADLTGALALPASVWHDDKYWVLLEDLANVTTYEPGVDTTYWGLVLHDSEWPPGTAASVTFDGDDSTEVYTYAAVEIGRVESVKTTPGATTVITQSITKNGVDTVETYTFAADGSIAITYALA